MGLPNIGPLELIIILAIALLIVGPGRLPEMGNAIGRTIREFRKASSDITDAASGDSDARAATPVTPADSAPTPPNTLSGEAKPNTTTLAPEPATPPEPRSDGDDDA